MKIYTKTGDEGQTSLIGGSRVYKSDLRIESYGTVDELNSHLGLVRDLISEDALKKFLENIQNQLFTIGSNLALEPGKSSSYIPELNEAEIDLLENKMDQMDESLPVMKNFVLPGGHPIVSHCHISRTVCRRAERRVIELSQNEEVNSLIIKYLNRLSDFLFVLSRKLTLDLKVTEIPWKPEK